MPAGLMVSRQGVTKRPFGTGSTTTRPSADGGARQQPRVAKYGNKAGSVLGPYPQAGADKVLALAGHAAGKVQLGLADGLVGLKGDVAAHHVEEEDPQGPYSQGLGFVLGATDPLGRSIDSGSCNDNLI